MEILKDIINISRFQTVSPAKSIENDDSDIMKIYDEIKDDKTEALKSFIKCNSSDRIKKFRHKSGTAEDNSSNDTLLHAAVLKGSINVVTELMFICPELATVERMGDFNGQTALHIAIAQGKFEIAKQILSTKIFKDIPQMLAARATGSKLTNNIMMGETPLSVAVLTFQSDMVDLLLEKGARIVEPNSKGDNVIHSLIKYVAIEKEKEAEAINWLRQLSMSEIVTNPDFLHQLWFSENLNGRTPLKLTVENGLNEFFKFLISLENVFCLSENGDGSFDTNLYDVTEIDNIAQTEYRKLKSVPRDEPCCSCQRFKSYVKLQSKIVPSVIEMLGALEWKNIKNLIEVDIIKLSIHTKWKKYRKYYFLFTLIHFIAMLLFTLSAYYRKFVIYSSTCNRNITIDECLHNCNQTEKVSGCLAKCNGKVKECGNADTFSKAVPWILFVYGLILILSELSRCWRLINNWHFSLTYHHNVMYRITLAVYALGLIIDCCLFTSGIDSNDVFVFTLLCGCWFFFFFLRGYDKFSFYTVIFQKVILGDLCRFGLIIVIEYTAFCFAMYIILAATPDNEQFSTFDNSTLTMFSYMLGLKELDIPEVITDESRRLLVAVYVLFIITSYIILLNLLIAMMSGTLDVDTSDKKVMTLLQKSSVTLFLDGFVPRPRISSKDLGLVVKGDHQRYYLPLKIEDKSKIVIPKTDPVAKLREIVSGYNINNPTKKTSKREIKSNGRDLGSKDYDNTTPKTSKQKPETVQTNKQKSRESKKILDKPGPSKRILDINTEDE